MRGFFVTGTGTGVGKTAVSVALVGALKAMGMDVCAMKPVESGCADGQPADGRMLLSASGVSEPLNSITPFRLRAPLAPMVAARLEGVELEADAIVSSVRELAGRHDMLVVEGVGGFMVPLLEDYFVRDLAVDLGLPVVLVASTSLGTISQTLLTLESLDRAGLRLAGIVLNEHESPEGTEAERTNPGVIEELTGMPLLGLMPYMEELTVDGLLKAGRERLRADMLRRFF